MADGGRVPACLRHEATVAWYSSSDRGYAMAYSVQEYYLL